jgi:polyvinyl alcohol dehydrogenase (cytochrome)
MRTKRTRGLAAIGIVVSTLVACGARSPEDARAVGLNANALSSLGVTEDPAAKSADWPSAGHDWSHSGHNSGERAIGKTNVAQLAVAWQHEFSPAPDVKVPVVAVPVAAEGVAYIADAAGFVHARNLATGALLWTTSASHAAPDPVFQSVIQAGPVVTGDSLYVGDAAATIHKLDRSTGSLGWSRVVDSNPRALIQGDLTTYGKYVLFGVSSFENATIPAGDLTMRGSIAAVNLTDGELAWQSYTTSDQTLESPKYGAGVGVWSSPAIDPKSGRLFIGTGQFYEAGSTSPGKASKNDKDLSDSLLSVSISDGKIRDSRQFTAGDIFGLQHPDGPDSDVGAPPNLFEIDGGKGCRAIEAVGVGDKTGTYRVLDRKNLKVIWEKHVAKSSVLGGFQATAAVGNGIVYVAAHELLNGDSLQTVIPPGQSATWLGTPEGFKTVQSLSRTNIMALNANTGAVIWETKTLGAITFAPVILANGVVYQGDVNGAVRGFDADTGALLWQAQLGGFPAGANPDGTPIYAVGNMITGMSISRGRLMVSYLPLLPTSPSGVTAYGLPNP